MFITELNLLLEISGEVSLKVGGDLEYDRNISQSCIEVHMHIVGE